MPPRSSRPNHSQGGGRYQVRVRGHLSPAWADWFDGMTISLEDDGHTVISGPVADQSALHGLLRKLRDLGLVLISLNRIDPCAELPPDADQQDGAASMQQDHEAKRGGENGSNG